VCACKLDSKVHFKSNISGAKSKYFIWNGAIARQCRINRSVSRVDYFKALINARDTSLLQLS
jgi:hypothetical protein